MTLTLNADEIHNILLAWAQKHFPEADFNTALMETYTYAPSVAFTCEKEAADEAL
jgi:hypothetical protein